MLCMRTLHKNSELLGITEEFDTTVKPSKQKTESEKLKFCKHHINNRSEDVINRHLDDNRKAHMEKDEKPMAAEEIPLRLDECYHKAIRKMLKKNEPMWSGELEKSLSWNTV